MAFYKVARAPIIRVASSNPQERRGFAKKAGSNLIDPDYLSEMSRKYAISKNAADYGYVVVRAVTSDTPNCFIAGTRVLLSNGTSLPIEEVQVGSEVITHKGRVRKVVRTFDREYTGMLYNISVVGQPEALTCTPNHNIFSASGVRKEYYRSYQSQWRKGDKKSVDQSDTRMDWTRCPILPTEAADITHDSYFLQPNNVDVKLPTELKDISSDLFLARLWGYHLAEGCFAKRPNDSLRIVLTFNTVEDECLIRDIEKNLPERGRSPFIVRGYKDNPLITRIEISWSRIARLFRCFTGSGASKKFIHPALIQMPLEWKRHFLAGYLQGDGCLTSDSSDSDRQYIKGSSVSFDLVSGLKLMLSSLGILMSSNSRYNKFSTYFKGKKIYEYSISNSQIAQILTVSEKFRLKATGDLLTGKSLRKGYFTEEGTLTKVKDINIMSIESAHVFNLEVEEDHSYVANGICVKNCNGDAFTASELLRPHIEAKCRVYQTFCYAPHHVNHKSEDPQGARGFVVDAHYNTVDDPDYHFVECVVALDKKKDPHWASAILEGRLDNFSMGCLAEYTICSICNNKATSPRELCAHVRNSRMQRINGKLAYEECYGVTFRELSGVDRGADRSARTRAVLSPKTMPIAPPATPGRISVAALNLER